MIIKLSTLLTLCSRRLNSYAPHKARLLAATPPNEDYVSVNLRRERRGYNASKQSSNIIQNVITMTTTDTDQS